MLANTGGTKVYVAPGAVGKVFTIDGAGAPSWAAPASDGWHGSTTRIKILPRDFVANDVGRPLMIEDDNVASDELWMHGLGTMFAYVPIPTGYKATHAMVYGNNTLQSYKVYEGDIDSISVTALGSNSIGTEENITDVNSNTTNYIVLSAGITGVLDRIYGGYITIAEI